MKKSDVKLCWVLSGKSGWETGDRRRKNKNSEQVIHHKCLESYLLPLEKPICK